MPSLLSLRRPLTLVAIALAAARVVAGLLLSGGEDEVGAAATPAGKRKPAPIDPEGRIASARTGAQTFEKLVGAVEEVEE